MDLLTAIETALRNAKEQGFDATAEALETLLMAEKKVAAELAKPPTHTQRLFY